MALFDGVRNFFGGARNIIEGVKETIAPVKDVLDFAGNVLGVKSSKAGTVRGGTAAPFMEQSALVNLQLQGSNLGQFGRLPRQTATTSPQWMKYLSRPGGVALMQAVSQHISSSRVSAPQVAAVKIPRSK